MDRITAERRSSNMRRIKSKDTSPEMIVRRLVHRLGYRYRLHDHSLPGRPDLVFRSRKKLIFVHGCFWHSHENCSIAHKPKSQTAYWWPKLRRNKIRDREHRKALSSAGWGILVLWECEVKKAHGLKNQIITFLEDYT